MSIVPELDLEALARTATRYPRSAYLDLLAHRATGGEMNAAQLVAFCRGGGPAPTPPSLDAPSLAWFGLAAAARIGVDIGVHTTIDDVVSVFESALQRGGLRSFEPKMIRVWIEALHHLGRLDEAGRSLREARAGGNRWWCASTDALNPYLSSSLRSIDRWLAELSRPFTDGGLAPLRLIPGDDAPFDRIGANADPLPDADLPMVSVVIPVFDPGPSLRTAVQSITGQTWTNLEILLCNDASPVESRQVLDECAALDPRVRIIHNPVNGGAYDARNLGLAHARGEFVTFQDADDWSHPQRLERQIRPLIETETLQATVSQALGVDVALGLTSLGRGPRRLNTSSLTFRRVPVLGKLGGFDTVRRGADTEFLLRLEAVFGQGSVRKLTDCLALVQLTHGSLSRNDYGLLRKHPARQQYRAMYTYWHHLIDIGAESAFILPPSRAPFPAPAYVSGRPQANVRRYDVVLLADLGAHSPTSVDIAHEVDALCETGLRLGLVDCPAPFDLTVPTKPPATLIAQRVRAGDAVHALPGDHLQTRLAIVRDPAAVTGMANDVVADVTADQFLLIADYAPDSGRRYDPATIENVLHDRFSGRVAWLPATERLSAEIHSAAPDAYVLAPELWGCLSPHERTTGGTLSRPVVGTFPPSGTFSRAALRSWGESVLPRDPRTSLWAWGRVRHLARALSRPLLGLDPALVRLESFLRQVSYVVIPPSIGRGAHLHRLAVRALGHGCIPILDPSFRDHFGAAALYSGHTGMDGWIRLHTTRPELYRDQQRLGFDFLDNHLSPARLQRTFASIIDDVTDGGTE